MITEDVYKVIYNDKIAPDFEGIDFEKPNSNSSSSQTSEETRLRIENDRLRRQLEYFHGRSERKDIRVESTLRGLKASLSAVDQYLNDRVRDEMVVDEIVDDCRRLLLSLYL